MIGTICTVLGAATLARLLMRCITALDGTEK